MEGKVFQTLSKVNLRLGRKVSLIKVLKMCVRRGRECAHITCSPANRLENKELSSACQQLYMLVGDAQVVRVWHYLKVGRMDMLKSQLELPFLCLDFHLKNRKLDSGEYEGILRQQR